MCHILPHSPSEILKSAVSSFFYLAGLRVDPTDAPVKSAWRGPLHQDGSQFLVQSVLTLVPLAPVVPEVSFAAAVVSQDRRETQL